MAKTPNSVADDKLAALAREPCENDVVNDVLHGRLMQFVAWEEDRGGKSTNRAIVQLNGIMYGTEIRINLFEQWVRDRREGVDNPLAVGNPCLELAPTLEASLVDYVIAQLQALRDERDTQEARVKRLEAALQIIADFAVGNGDVCEIIAKRARAALKEIENG